MRLEPSAPHPTGGLPITLKMDRVAPGTGNNVGDTRNCATVPGVPLVLPLRLYSQEYSLCHQFSPSSVTLEARCCLLAKAGTRMNKMMATATLSLALMSSPAMAQERAGDAALGALSGAVVLGPIGAVAGAVIGYTAGPSIASSWGLHRSSAPRQARRAASRDTRVIAGDGQPLRNAPNDQASPQAAAPARLPATTATASTAPPVQSLE
jgi:hypothetical protein